MTDTLLREVAYAMEAPKCLLPHLPYLLQDLPSLSGAEDDVVEVFSEIGFPSGGTVLDLGCGRGEIAQQSAKEANVQEHCRFIAADLRGSLAASAQYDAVLMIAVGPILGAAVLTISMLRDVARDGGWIIIDDAYLEDGVAPSSDYADYLDREQMEAGLTHFGDAIVARRIGSASAKSYNALALETIPRRAKALAEQHPELQVAIDQYVARQISEVALMEGPVVPALWAIQKSSA